MRKSQTFFKWITFFVVLCGYSGFAFGQIEIRTVADLRAIRGDGDLGPEAADKSYILMNDIDLAGEVWLENDLPYSFEGTFDGNNHVIKNFTFDGEVAGNPIAFFRHLRGTVKNLGFENAMVNGRERPTAVIVGRVIGGNIENCYVTNSTVISTNTTDNDGRTGGVVADTDAADGKGATIKGCYVLNSTITGGPGTGGVVGRAAVNANVSQCYAEYTTVYGLKGVGGVVGRLVNNSTASQLYSSNVIVNGLDGTGGVLGRIYSSSSISDSYSSARVNSRSYQAGGVVGQAIDAASSISNCYFSGVLTRYGDNRAGGIMALDDSPGTTISNSVNLAAKVVSDAIYRISSLNGRSVELLTNNYALENLERGRGNEAESGEDVSMADAKTQSFYQNVLGWDFGTIWKMTNGYPVLKWQTEVRASAVQESMDAFALQLKEGGQPLDLTGHYSGNGLELSFSTNDSRIMINNGKVELVQNAVLNDIETAEVIVSVNDSDIADGKIIITLIPSELGIATAEEFIDKVNAAPGGNFKLTADLDFTGIDFRGIESFSGSLEGNGHIIKGITYSNGNTSNVALFCTTTNAVIKNLGLEEVDLKGNENIAGIVGTAQGGRIEQCYVTNSVINGRDRAAGIVAYAGGDIIIENCYVIANIIAREQQKGGVVGATNGAATINNCYFAGTIQGGRFSGSMLGLLDRDETVTIENCVNLASSITGAESPSRIGTFGGRGTYANFINNYSISTTVGKDWNVESPEDGNNLPNDEDAKSMEFYTQTLGWSTDVWKIVNGYPIFTWQQSPVNIRLSKEAYNYVWNLGQVIDLNEEIIAMNGATLTFTSSNEHITINENNIATVSEEIEGTLKANITVSAENSAILGENIINVMVIGEGVIKISSPSDLAYITSNPSRDFELVNDIDMTNIEFTALCSSNDPFTGKFDGKGYTIKGLQFNDENVGNMGLFSKIQGAQISNLGLVDINFRANENIGGIAGIADGGTITQCYVAGSTISGKQDRAAGIVGLALGGLVIEDCYVQADIIMNSNQAGGIVGASQGELTLRNCYFEGTIKGAWGHYGSMNGLVDSDNNVTIENCINLATSIIGDNTGNYYRIGNWGGREAYAHFSNNYSISTTQAGQDKVWNEEDARDAKTLSDDTEAMSMEFYQNTLNWDFETVWTINEGEGYPTLKVFVREEGVVVEGNVMKVLSGFNLANLADLFIPDYITGVDLREVNLIAGTTLPTPVNPNCLIYVNEDSDSVIANTTNVVVAGDNATAVKIELTDDNDFANIMEFTTSDITFTRTDLTPNNFSSIYLPFSVAIPEGMKAYAFDKIEGGVAKFEEVTDILAENTPYLFKNTTGELALSVQTPITIRVTQEANVIPDSFIGTFSSINPTGNYYGYSDGKFVQGSNVEVPAFRAYLQGQSGAGAPASLALQLSDVTGIEGIVNAEMIILSAQGAIEIITPQEQLVNIYSVEGHLVRAVVLSEGYNKIDGLTAGLYLVNNNKVMVK